MNEGKTNLNIVNSISVWLNMPTSTIYLHPTQNIFISNIIFFLFVSDVFSQVMQGLTFVYYYYIIYILYNKLM